MPNLIRKRFGYGQLWPIRPACSQNRAGSCMPDPTSTHQIRFGSSKEDMDYTVQNWPGSDLDGLVRISPNASGLEASRCAGIIGPGSGKRQPAATSFQLSDATAFFHRRPGSYFTKPARIRYSSGSSGGLCQVWAKRIRSGSKPVGKNHRASFWLTLPSRFGPHANRIRHVYWDNVQMKGERKPEKKRKKPGTE